MRKPQWVLVTLFVLALFQIQHYSPLLPATLASHFDGAGKPNGFEAKAAFFRIYVLILALLLALFLFLPKLLRRLPDSLINLPNKDYWLSPERREETLSAVEDGTAWMGVLTMGLVVFIMQLTIRTNLTEHSVLTPSVVLPALGLFMAATVVWLVSFITRFRRPA